uniref:Si:dkey-217d24.6 n=1 Tax=Cyclopterus lumpus TaxID=8103 RepID=A0A8C2WLI3_CYCLU
HARLHLRQLGVTLSESSGAPIELLYQLIQERGDSLPDFKGDSVHGPTPLKKAQQQGSRTSSAPEDRGDSSKAESSSSSSEHQTKPLWAPLETDAPITLAKVVRGVVVCSRQTSDATNEVHVCQLCGCWYGTRKGLSGHARAHLRQIGIPDSDIKGSPIDLLYQIMEEEDLKPISSEQQAGASTSNSPSKSSSKRPSNRSAPPVSLPSKRPKTSEDFTCILCGEKFENHKGLAIHARAHLRQIGVVDLLGKSSAIDTVQELVSSGMLEAVPPPKMNSATSSSAAPSPSTSLSPIIVKWYLLGAISQKPAINPIFIFQMYYFVCLLCVYQRVDSSSSFLFCYSTDVQSPPTVLCNFCGQLFETRKALSCHARAHLRQLGLTWSIRTSPIDLLKEVMMRGEEGKKVSVPTGSSGKATCTPQGSRRSLDSLQMGEPAANASTAPLDYSMKEKPSSGRSGGSHTGNILTPLLTNSSLCNHFTTMLLKDSVELYASCELCGFDFENRKALASHARAHLRQLGIIEWKADGASSPIELLSELIRRDPVKVAAITQRYRMGDLYIKKVGCAVKYALHYFNSQQDTYKQWVHPPKRVVPAGEENHNTNSQQPSRSGSIPAMLPKPPLTPLVKLVGKVYSLKCRFCEEVFHGPLSVQERWITHLQKHILSLGYKGKASPPAAPVAALALVQPVAV